MKGNLSLVALLTLVVATPSFGMDINSLISKTQPSVQAARHAFNRMARAGSDGLIAKLTDRPILVPSACLGAFALNEGVATWRDADGTKADKAKAVLNNRLVTVPAGLSLATFAASFVPQDTTTALVQRFPVQTIAAWSKTVAQLLKDNPYYAATAAVTLAAFPAYKVYKLWNATAPVSPATTTAATSTSAAKDPAAAAPAVTASTSTTTPAPAAVSGLTEEERLAEIARIEKLLPEKINEHEATKAQLENMHMQNEDQRAAEARLAQRKAEQARLEAEQARLEAERAQQEAQRKAQEAQAEQACLEAEQRKAQEDARRQAADERLAQAALLKMQEEAHRQAELAREEAQRAQQAAQRKAEEDARLAQEAAQAEQMRDALALEAKKITLLSQEDANNVKTVIMQVLLKGGDQSYRDDVFERMSNALDYINLQCLGKDEQGESIKPIYAMINLCKKQLAAQIEQAKAQHKAPEAIARLNRQAFSKLKADIAQFLEKLVEAASLYVEKAQEKTTEQLQADEEARVAQERTEQDQAALDKAKANFEREGSSDNQFKVTVFQAVKDGKKVDNRVATRACHESRELRGSYGIAKIDGLMPVKMHEIITKLKLGELEDVGYGILAAYDTANDKEKFIEDMQFVFAVERLVKLRKEIVQE